MVPVVATSDNLLGMRRRVAQRGRDSDLTSGLSQLVSFDKVSDIDDASSMVLLVHVFAGAPTLRLTTLVAKHTAQRFVNQPPRLLGSARRLRPCACRYHHQ